MKNNKTNYSGIWPLVEEYQLREKAKKFGYYLQKDMSKTEKLVKVIKEFNKATNNFRCFLLSIFIVASGWNIVINLLSVFGSLQLITNVFTKIKIKL